MRIPKRYGESRVELCPFCSYRALAKNSEGVPTCENHKDTFLNAKCACGESLLPLSGKYGVFFNCSRCGNLSLKKVLEIKRLQS